MSWLHRIWVLAFALLVGAPADAGEWSVKGKITTEHRMFAEDPAWARQRGGALWPSLAVEPEFVYAWNQDNDRLILTPFLRWDVFDGSRSHADLREANWLHLGDGWDFTVGLGKVFWGSTESRHLVDIINQTDLVENIDNEDKLGQPMINLNLDRAWGTVGLFLLPGFRERTFPGSRERLAGAFPFAPERSTYESGAAENHVDIALRWSHSIGDWDLGFSHFLGTSREPRLIVTTINGETLLTPHYDQINQTGLDLQFTAAATLWKLEAITRGGQGNRFAAAAGGLEHTFFGVFETAADIGALLEYQYDGRDQNDAPSTSADDDVFAALRLTLNDEQDTAVLAGATVDRSTRSTLLFVEAERRLSDDWRFELEGRFFLNVDDTDPAAGLKNDSFLTLRLIRFF